MRICEKIRTSAVFIAEVRSFNNSYRLQEAYVQGPQSQKSPRMHDVVPIVVTIAVRMVMTISRTRFQGNFFIIVQVFCLGYVFSLGRFVSAQLGRICLRAARSDLSPRRSVGFIIRPH